jgi:PAS fold.
MTESFLGGRVGSFSYYFFDGVYIVDNRRKILFWNKRAEKITGYSKE